ncbi:MAG: M4 family metallopeptidase [Saprospiraceae bacterium]|nr:M4 family metallopeptidase [Saprospiraceae bacterium]MDW8230846.1 M4 family metallopeptidase [Saprospiraceae bacterium]
MKKSLLFLAFATLLQDVAFAQSAKTTPPADGPQPAPERLRLNPWPGRFSVPLAEPPLMPEAFPFRPIGVLQLPESPAEAAAVERTLDAESGLPIWFSGRVKTADAAEANRPIEQRALAYLAALRPNGIEHPEAEFVPRRAHQDEQGAWHVRLEQVYQGVPVYGAEVIAHTQNGAFAMLNGRYYPTPQLATTMPTISAEEALQRVRAHVGPHKTDWTDDERALVGGQEVRTELVIYHLERRLDAERLAWVVTLYADLLHRKVYFVDAHDGSILHHFDHTCRIAPFHGTSAPTLSTAPAPRAHTHDAIAAGNGNPVTGSGLDLRNINRTFGAWQIGSNYYMEDASKPMFNAAASQMPNKPVGVIVTLNAKNTTPSKPNTFDYTIVISNSTVFNNRSAVSAHWNAIQSHDYFRSTHGRNSIDGKGGNIISFFNVADDNGGPMDNAYWNGFAMWYGAGNTFFFDLARGLDVGAHEMGHGVIENTANLEYQYESGALNESFADVFGACVDRGDWLIGEDVVRPGATPNNCLRDMQFPNNGSPAQPKHMSEKYVGPQNNGGVHINSGIVNRAFVLFATHSAVGLDRAERVYYKALRDYLVKSSQFIDCRLAVIQAATDLYGSAVANAAANAFATVGIGGGQPTNPFGLLKENPGVGLIVSKTNNGALLDLHRDNGQYVGTLYNGGVASRPSVSDDGKQIVFVNSEGHIIAIDLQNVAPNLFYQVIQLSQFPEWRNVAISKNGRFLAALTDVADNRIYVFDLGDPVGNSRAFTLHNPTYSPTGQTTSEVLYADVLEFDYSNQYIMYDAFNRLVSTTGQILEYWDIGFMRFWQNNAFTPASPPISKMFNSLPPESSVGNPVFSQMAPFVIAFDYVDGLNDDYHILGANVQTGDVDYLVAYNGVLGWPSYTRTDNTLLFERRVSNQYNLYQRTVAPNRIQGTGASAPLVISAHDWGRWFGFGTRSLQVSAPTLDAAALQLTASPNPATDALRLSFELPQSSPVRAEVTDLLGRTTRTLAQELTAGAQQLDLDLQGLPAGTYVVRLWAGSATAALKVVKQ